MLKVGVIGAGHLGQIHLKILKKLNKDYELIGFYDSDKEKSKKLNRELRIKSFKKFEDLLEETDVITIATPTKSHFEYAKEAIKAHKHVFIEKPISNSNEEAETLIKLSNEASVKIQIGHVERFNPAFIAAEPFCKHPLFIETHRLSEFNIRGTDVSVVLDLMIHDIDIILSIVKSNVKKIHASGVALISNQPDIANARIEFDNGCVANLTASRISLKKMRKTRIFEKDAYVSIDFLEKKTEIIKLSDIKKSEKDDPYAIILETAKGKKDKKIYFENPEILENNAIEEEFKCFKNSIQNDTKPIVSIEDGYYALQIANKIIEKLNTFK